MQNINKLNLIFVSILGGISSFAFAPFNQVYLIFFGYFALFYSFYISRTYKESFLYGLFFGFFHFVIGLYWLFSIVKDYDTSYWAIIAIILFGIIIILALLFAFLGLLSFYFKDRLKFKNDWFILIPIIALLFEWLRSWIFTGLPWFMASHALFDIGFKSLLPFIGELGISFLFFILISLLVRLTVKKDFKSFGYMLSYLILLAISLYFTKDIAHTKRLKNSLNIQILKSNFQKVDKGSRYKVYAQAKSFLYKTMLEPTPDLAIWSESSVAIDYKNITKALLKEFKEADKKSIQILFGTYITKNNKHYNVIVDSKTFKPVYIKKHLIPFGEYMPKWFKLFEKFLPKIFMSDLDTMQMPLVYKVKDINISLSICYELLFIDELRESIDKSNLLVHVSDLGWFDNSFAKDYLLQVARIRAIESAKPMIYVVNSGDSGYITYDGKVDLNSDHKKIYARSGTTIYIKYIHNLTIFIMFLLIFLIILKNFANILPRSEK